MASQSWEQRTIFSVILLKFNPTAKNLLPSYPLLQVTVVISRWLFPSQKILTTVHERKKTRSNLLTFNTVPKGNICFVFMANLTLFFWECLRKKTLLLFLPLLIPNFMWISVSQKQILFFQTLKRILFILTILKKVLKVCVHFSHSPLNAVIKRPFGFCAKYRVPLNVWTL